MSEQKQPQRWYIVADKKDGASCLVEASNKAQAYRRAGEFYCMARPATVDEALRMARDGRDVIYAPSEPEQLDLADSVVTGATSPAPVKEGSDPEASEPSDASGPLTDEPELPKVTDIVPEALRAPVTMKPNHAVASALESEARMPRKASEVFGAGFGPRGEPDVG